MKPSDFIEQIDDARLIAAIVAAEKRTSGEIRVHISHQERSDALAAARVRFAKLGMHRTALRNATLIYLVPRSRTFAIMGDAGIHAKCGDDFWQQISTQLSADLKMSAPTEALVKAIHAIGELLATHFPALAGDRNELPNEIERD